jgi:hypothetical protein
MKEHSRACTHLSWEEGATAQEIKSFCATMNRGALEREKKSSLECPDLRQRESRDPEEREGGSPNGHQYLGAAGGARTGTEWRRTEQSRAERLPAT